MGEVPIKWVSASVRGQPLCDLEVHTHASNEIQEIIVAFRPTLNYKDVQLGIILSWSPGHIALLVEVMMNQTSYVQRILLGCNLLFS